jgi:hypothetical protein
VSNTCVSISVPLQTLGDDFALTDSSDTGCRVRISGVRQSGGLSDRDIQRGRSASRPVGHSRGKEEASPSVFVFTFFSALSLVREQEARLLEENDEMMRCFDGTYNAALH